VVVFRAPSGSGWRFVVDGEFGRATYASEGEAMQASYDGAFWAAQKKPKVKVEPRARVEPLAVPCPACFVALGLPAGASLDEVKSAFRSRVWSAHPDAGGDGRDFVQLRRHYEAAVRLTSANGKALSGRP
jgi:hypothetical protein